MRRLIQLKNRRKPTPHPQPLPIQIEDNRDRHQSRRNTPQQRRSPLNAHIIEHLPRKQREARCQHRPTERICRDGRGRTELVRKKKRSHLVEGGHCDLQHEIRINQIIKQLDEHNQQPEAREEATERRRNPRHVGREARPSEPEDTRREERPANNHRRETPFGHRHAGIRLQLLVVRPARKQTDVGAADEQADDHPEERQPADAGVHVVHPLVDEAVRRQEAVQQPVDETEIERDGEDERFVHEQAQRAGEVVDE